MSDQAPEFLHSLIQRLQTGDLSARHTLISQSYGQLHRLVARMMRHFPIIEKHATTTDVLHECLIRLWKSLDKVPVSSPEGFFSLAALHVRRYLLDTVRSIRRRSAKATRLETPDTIPDLRSRVQQRIREQKSLDPASLLFWHEFHKHIETLPEEERDVFKLVFYCDMSLKDVAKLLSVSVPTIKRRLSRARLHLASYLNDLC